jgi:hypothetical protein
MDAGAALRRRHPSGYLQHRPTLLAGPTRPETLLEVAGFDDGVVLLRYEVNR